jgi:preprotein translocase subunit SecA
VYALRREPLEGRISLGGDEDEEPEVVDSRGYVMAIAEGLVRELVEQHAGREQSPEEWDIGGLVRSSADLFGLDPGLIEAMKLEESTSDEMADRIYGLAVSRFEEKEREIQVDPTILRRVERDVMLSIVDAQWKDHLYALDHLKEGIGLRGYGQRDPLVEYKKESFTLFQAMRGRIDEEMVRYTWRLRPVVAEGGAPAPVRPQARRPPPLTLSGGGGSALPGRTLGGASPAPARTGGDDAPVSTVRRDEPKIGRNDPCYCGSGKKYKKCHGA